MPELPEVETIRRDLTAELVGRAVERVSWAGARTLRRHADPDGVLAALAGRPVTAVGRRGKYLLVHLGGGPVVVVHLGMSGQLLVAEPADAPRPHTHLVVDVAGGRQLRFVDPRTFGEVFVSRAGPGATPPELAHLGFDPWPEPPAPADLRRRLAARRTALKSLLLDQRFVAGIGNMYADEILWAARIHPGRRAADLTRPQVDRLGQAMPAVLGAAVAHRGSSLADEQYRDSYGRIGGYQLHHRAYAREGRPCERCGRPIRRVVAGGRSTFFCPRCQVAPRVRAGVTPAR